MSIGLGQFWQSVPNLITSFLWTTELSEEKRDDKEKMTDKSNEQPTPNKSTLHDQLRTEKSLENFNDASVIDEAKPAEAEKKIQKNVSTLYRIISSQNIVLKKPEEIEISEKDGENTEYQEIKEAENFETGYQRSIAENAIYYVDEDKKSERGNESPEMKTSSIEIVLSKPNKARAKRSRSIIETNRSKCGTGPFFPMRKTNSTEASSDFGDLFSIRFSFLDEKNSLESLKTTNFEYDMISEKKSIRSETSSENPYSSPRNSVQPKGDIQNSDYVGPENPNCKELFYATSEILSRRPHTPCAGQKATVREDLYEDVDIENEKLPDIPKRGELTNDSDDYADVDIDDYCRHREENAKKLSLGNKGKSVNFTKVRSRINKTWKSMKNWIKEEKVIKESLYQINPKVEVTEIIHENLTASKLPISKAEVSRSESLRYLSSENMSFEADRTDATLSDSETYMDMTRFPSSESNGDIFTLLRRKKDGSSGSLPYCRSRCYHEGQSGFEELRRYIKQGGDFCKELCAILQERSEAETQYAKSLNKLSNKLLKTSKDAVGSVSEAWQRIGAEMEVQSEAHRTFAMALSEEVVKPLRQMIDSQHRVRKNVEAVVDKTGKTLSEWRQAECKSKKHSFLCARENEKLQDALLDVKNNRNASTLHLHHHNNHKNLSDKESAKLDVKRKKAEESVKKADIEYYSFCVRAERSRLEWETAVTRGSHCFQALEEERLSSLKNLAFCYLRNLKEVGPRLIQLVEDIRHLVIASYGYSLHKGWGWCFLPSNFAEERTVKMVGREIVLPMCCDRLTEPIESCDVARDIQTVISLKGAGQPVQEQLLPDFYAEHITLAMNRERRKQALVKLLQLIRQDLERERRGKQGVENLQRALQQTPNFGAEESQQNVDEKLHHMRSMLIYLEAARYKVQSTLAELDGRPTPPHPLASHIQVTRDRQGLQQSILKVPQWATNDPMGGQIQAESPDWSGREAGDGTSVQPDSDFDEFSSVGSDKDYQSSVYNVPIISECSNDNCSEANNLGQCRALYDYSAKLYDELNLQIGDIIQIHDKQPDGWWLGELHGVVGIFPATYVEEIK